MCALLEVEKILHKGKSMAHLRERVLTDSCVEPAWKELVKGPLKHMAQRFKRLYLKEKPITVVPSATDEDMSVLQAALKADDFNPEY